MTLGNDLVTTPTPRLKRISRLPRTSSPQMRSRRGPLMAELLRYPTHITRCWWRRFASPRSSRSSQTPSRTAQDRRPPGRIRKGASQRLSGLLPRHGYKPGNPGWQHERLEPREAQCTNPSYKPLFFELEWNKTNCVLHIASNPIPCHLLYVTCVLRYPAGLRPGPERQAKGGRGHGRRGLRPSAIRGHREHVIPQDGFEHIAGQLR